MRKLYIHIILLLQCTLLCSCHRQMLEEWYFTKAKIPISVNWEECRINPQNVSLFFYNQDGSYAFHHYFENNNNKIQSYVEVSPGIYSVRLFNELPNQIENLFIENRYDFKDIDAMATSAKDVYLPIADDKYYAEPSPLASIIIRRFEVTPEMVFYTNEPLWMLQPIEQEEIVDPAHALIGLIPLRDLSLFKMNIHVKGLNNSRMPILMTLLNVSYKYYFDNKENGNQPANYQCDVTNKIGRAHV